MSGFLRQDATFTAISTSDVTFTIVSATQTDYVSGIFKAPLNQNYNIVDRIPYNATIQRFSVRTLTGTCTATLKINSTTVGNCSLSASTSPVSAVANSDNTITSTNTLVITVSIATSPGDLSWTVEYTRTLA